MKKANITMKWENWFLHARYVSYIRAGNIEKAKEYRDSFKKPFIEAQANKESKKPVVQEPKKIGTEDEKDVLCKLLRAHGKFASPVRKLETLQKKVAELNQES